MPKPYSWDLRERVLKRFKENVLHKDIASKLDISIRTVGRYYKKYKQTGNAEVKREIKNYSHTRFYDFDGYLNYIPTSFFQYWWRTSFTI